MVGSGVVGGGLRESLAPCWMGRQNGMFGWEEMKKKDERKKMEGTKNGQAERSVDLVQNMLGLCTAENETKTDELLQAGASGTSVETNSGSRGRESSCKGGKH